MSLFFLRSVHCSIVPRYCIAENFRGRKLSRISQFYRYTQKFTPRNLGRGVLWHCKCEQSTKVFSTIVFSPIRKSFLPLKFPAIRYVLKFIERACRWHLEIYHSCSNRQLYFKTSGIQLFRIVRDVTSGVHSLGVLEYFSIEVST